MINFSPTHCQHCGVLVKEEYDPQWPRRQTCPSCRGRIAGDRMIRWRQENSARRNRKAEACRRAQRAGREYLSREERHRRAEVRRQARAARPKRQRTPTETWIARLREMCPDLYDATKSKNTLAWRARYHLDPEFKAKEIARTLRRRSAEHGDPLFEDGSLTGPVIQRLFAVAIACPYCARPMGGRDKTFDHIMPRHLGGWHSVRNVVVCCYSCNSRKADTPPQRWLMRLPRDRRDSVRALWRAVMGALPWETDAQLLLARTG